MWPVHRWIKRSGRKVSARPKLDTLGMWCIIFSARESCLSPIMWSMYRVPRGESEVRDILRPPSEGRRRNARLRVMVCPSRSTGDTSTHSAA
eukprot:scaffold55225_cov33-Tisochrysis_lutea.AAC.1